jgi:hypothetical protein
MGRREDLARLPSLFDNATIYLQNLLFPSKARGPFLDCLSATIQISCIHNFWETLS